jgi:hypothetical protein
MKTIIAFFSFLICLFNTSISIFIVRTFLTQVLSSGRVRTQTRKVNGTGGNSPNRNITLTFQFFPVELIIHSILTLFSLIYGNYIQLIICLIAFVYNANMYYSKKYRTYYSLGEFDEKHNNEFSFSYKVKFVYYFLLTLICLIKFIVTLTDMLSYNLFGKTNLFFSIIEFISSY